MSSAVDDDEWRARAADGDVQHHRHAYCRRRIVDYKKLRNNSDVAQVLTLTKLRWFRQWIAPWTETWDGLRKLSSVSANFPRVLLHRLAQLFAGIDACKFDIHFPMLDLSQTSSHRVCD